MGCAGGDRSCDLAPFLHPRRSEHEVAGVEGEGAGGVHRDVSRPNGDEPGRRTRLSQRDTLLRFDVHSICSGWLLQFWHVAKLADRSGSTRLHNDSHKRR